MQTGGASVFFSGAAQAMLYERFAVRDELINQAPDRELTIGAALGSIKEKKHEKCSGGPGQT
jgi:hypothetical protein